jgi:hypothetical protein
MKSSCLQHLALSIPYNSKGKGTSEFFTCA